MLPEDSEAYLERDLKALEPRLHDLAIEKIERNGLLLYGWIRARSVNGARDLYVFRLDCKDYPERATDITFLDPETLQPDIEWWPKDYRQRNRQSSIFRTRQGDLGKSFVCAPPFWAWQSHGHPKPDPSEWTLEKALEAIFLSLNLPEYAGYCR